MGLFDATEIPNDLKAVDEKIRAYYELDDPFITHDERPAETPVAEEPAKEETPEEEPKQEEEPRRQRRVRKER